MRGNADPVVTEPKRIRQFAGFFKNYMGVSTFVVAALPVPVNLARLIPVYPPDAGSMTVITSLLCFLLLSYIFYNRHRTAKILFYEIEESEAAAPTSGGSEPERYGSLAANPMALQRTYLSLAIYFLILGSAGCFFLYQLIWMRYGFALGHTFLAFDQAMVRLELMACYVGFFTLAEAAFVLMASKEYLQDLLGLSDNQLIRGLRRRSARAQSGAAAPPTSDV